MLWVAVGSACIDKEQCIWRHDVRSSINSNRRGVLGRDLGQEGQDGVETESLVYDGRNDRVFEERVVDLVS